MAPATGYWIGSNFFEPDLGARGDFTFPVKRVYQAHEITASQDIAIKCTFKQSLMVCLSHFWVTW